MTSFVRFLAVLVICGAGWEYAVSEGWIDREHAPLSWLNSDEFASLTQVFAPNDKVVVEEKDGEKNEPKQEEPKKEQPKEEPKKEEPKKEEPKKEEPKKEEPKKEEPKKEEPKVPLGPLVDHPVKVDVPDAVKGLLPDLLPENIGQLKAMEDHFRKLVEKVTPCTVGVQIGPAQGSGVIVSKDGYVLTAAHVAGKPGRNATLIFPDGKRVKGTTLGTNHGIDAGLIKITDQGDWPHCELASSRVLKQGQWVLATGHPGGYMPDRKPVVRVGRILASRRGVVVTDCTLVGGDSGGPLFDMNGKVVGIHSRIGGSLTANMHVPVDAFKDSSWVRLASSEDWGGDAQSSGPYLGVSGDPESDDAKVTEVQPGSPAAKAGIKEGDIILKFDGKEVKDIQALAILVRTKKPGDKVKIELRRDGKTQEMEATIGDRSAN